MLVAYAPKSMLVWWLITAKSYLKSSHRLQPHTNLACYFVFKINLTRNVKFLTSLNACYRMLENIQKYIKVVVKLIVHFCLKNKREQYLACIVHIYYFYHFFSITKHHSGSPIKWWEGVCCETKRSNILICLLETFWNNIVERSSENAISYAIIHRSKKMAEASSTRNLDVCIVEENEVINTSQKRTTSAQLTITQKKAKNKKT